MPVLTLSIDIETLGHEHHHYHLVATPHEREGVANRLNLLSLARLEADIHLLQNERIRMTGKIVADVTQVCVRTLQPLPQHLEIDVDEFFTLTSLEKDEEVILSEEDVVEVLEGTILDIGEVVIQLYLWISIHFQWPLPQYLLSIKKILNLHHLLKY